MVESIRDHRAQHEISWVEARYYFRIGASRGGTTSTLTEIPSSVILVRLPQKEELQQQQFDLLSAKVDVAGHVGVVLGMPMGDDQTRRPKSTEVKKSVNRVAACCPPTNPQRDWREGWANISPGQAGLM